MATCDKFHTISQPPLTKHLFPGHLETYFEQGQDKTYAYLWLFTSFKGRFLSKILPVTMDTD
jgi:hypothetical protein